MCRAPRLGASGGRGEAGRKIVELLEGVADGNPPLVTGADHGAEIFLDLAANKEDHAVKARPDGIVHGIIEEGLAAGSDWIKLLEPAIAGAHTGSENEEGG